MNNEHGERLECCKCRQPIMDFSDARIITIRVAGKPKEAWVHADHAAPSYPFRSTSEV